MKELFILISEQVFVRKNIEYPFITKQSKIGLKIGFFGNFSLSESLSKMLWTGIDMSFNAFSFVFYAFLSRKAENVKTANFDPIFDCFVINGYSVFLQKKTCSEIRMKSSFK